MGSCGRYYPRMPRLNKKPHRQLESRNCSEYHQCTLPRGQATVLERQATETKNVLVNLFNFKNEFSNHLDEGFSTSPIFTFWTRELFVVGAVLCPGDHPPDTRSISSLLLWKPRMSPAGQDRLAENHWNPRHQKDKSGLFTTFTTLYTREKQGWQILMEIECAPRILYLVKWLFIDLFCSLQNLIWQYECPNNKISKDSNRKFTKEKKKITNKIWKGLVSSNKSN